MTTPHDPYDDAELEAFADEVQSELVSERWAGWGQEAPVLPAREQPDPAPATAFWRPRRVAAAALLLALAIWPWFRERRTLPIEYEVAVHLDEGVALQQGVPARLRLGQVLETQPGMHARIAVPGMGEVVLEPESRLRVGDARAIDGEHLLALESGAVTASILAPPRRFQLGTPGGVAVDLGCVYRAEVLDEERTLVRVVAGAVSFEAHGRQVYVPQGASVLAQVATGPGTPILDDAPQRLRQILAQLDAGQPLGVGDDHFAILFELCRPEDSLSIWHLMMHAEGAQRFVYAKLLDRLVPMPEPYEAEACVEPGSEANLAWYALQPWS
ncbi:MAG: hypothetical protein CMJ94_13685 [Planctomycetes bacterium]|nr:hypothetical protein [Planctomycetota bacterium]